MTDTAQDLVEDAYRVMSGPRPGDHQACTQCCMSQHSHRLFLDTDRRDLPVAFLDDWYHAAFGGPATPELRRYLLPCVMELLLAGQEMGLGVELALQRFDTGVPALWTPAEQEIIDRFTALFLDLQAVGRSPWGPLDDVLCMFALAGHDMTPILDHVWAWPDAALVSKLHADWCYPMGGIALWHTAFWDSDRPGVDEAAATVSDWYRAPRLRERCFDICLDDLQPDVIQHRASCLYEGLQSV